MVEHKCWATPKNANMFYNGQKELPGFDLVVIQVKKIGKTKTRQHLTKSNINYCPYCGDNLKEHRKKV